MRAKAWRCLQGSTRSEEHLFDRRSVVEDYQLWSQALEFGRCSNIDLTQLKQATASEDYIRPKKSVRKLTKKPVLAREFSIVLLAKDRARTCAPFCLSAENLSTELADDQRRAAEKILKSRDFVTLFRGGAGTGKSFALRAVKDELVRNGHSIQVLAPQRQQVIGLQASGLGEAKTISEFLTKGEMAPGSVLLVDEAGQVGAKQMLHLLGLAKAHGARVILSGDTRQHGAVEASEALRAIERYGLIPAELQENPEARPKIGKQPGKRLQLKANGKAVRGQTLANGELVTVRQVRRRENAGRSGDRELASELVSARGARVEIPLGGEKRQRWAGTIFEHSCAASRSGARPGCHEGGIHPIKPKESEYESIQSRT